MFGLGLPEILAILVVVLLVFGAGRLPEIGKQLGRGISEFKKGMSEASSEKDKDTKEKKEG